MHTQITMELTLIRTTKREMSIYVHVKDMKNKYAQINLQKKEKITNNSLVTVSLIV